MRTWLYAALAFAAVALQATVVPSVALRDIRPDLIALVVVYGSVTMGSRHATIAGFLMGLVADTSMDEYLGLNAFAYATVGYLAAGVWDHLVRKNVFVQCSVIAAAVLVHDAIYYLVYYRSNMYLYAPFLLQKALPGALYTAAIGALIYFLARVLGWETITGEHGT